jgi:hypothetical protein
MRLQPSARDWRGKLPLEDYAPVCAGFPSHILVKRSCIWGGRAAAQMIAAQIAAADECQINGGHVRIRLPCALSELFVSAAIMSRSWVRPERRMTADFIGLALRLTALPVP